MAYKVSIVGKSVVSNVAIVSPDTERSKSCTRSPEVYSQAELDELKRAVQAGEVPIAAANLHVERIGDPDKGQAPVKKAAPKTAAKKPARKRKSRAKKTAAKKSTATKASTPAE